MSQEMSSKIGGEEDEMSSKEEWEEKVKQWEEDDKEDKESKMSEDLESTCKKGPLEELKEKINSSNINSRSPFYV